MHERDRRPDWSSLSDCLWQRLFCLQFVYRHVHAADFEALYRTLTCACAALRHEMHRTWRELSRPYLSHIRPIHAYHVLACEMHQRRMIASIVARLGLVGVDDVCVAGGYAAWQLERLLDAEMGRDAFPRTIRGTHVWNGRPMRRVWIPGDVDLFVHCDDAELALDLVVECYREFATRLYSEHARVHTSSSEVYGDVDRDDDGVLPTEEYVEELARAIGLSEHCVSSCVDRRAETYAPCIVDTVHNVVVERHEPLFPLRLNVILTRAPPRGTPSYAAWVCQSFDMSHCRVAVAATDDGRLRFATSRTAVADLFLRRLRLTEMAFCNLRTCRNTVDRVDKYLSNGFTFEGDDVDALERLHDVLRHDRRVVDADGRGLF